MLKNLRLDENCINDLMDFVYGQYPLTKELAVQICNGSDPVKPCTQVYGCYKNGEGLVAIMTATYSITFPHIDGTRMVHISGAYTKESERHRGHALSLLEAIERDAKDFFLADYLCCDSTVDELYEKFGFVKANEKETRLWKDLTCS